MTTISIQDGDVIQLKVDGHLKSIVWAYKYLGLKLSKHTSNMMVGCHTLAVLIS